MSDAGWLLDEFLPRLHLWIETEQPDDRLVNVVREWIITRYDDPYRGARRADVAENLWFAVVPDTLRQGRVTACSFWIYERDHIVRCDAFASLSLPI